MRRGGFATLMHGFWWVAACLFATSLTRPAAADGDSTRLAADTYDAALAHYERAEYAVAARLFLEADTLHPSPEALSNAIAAARKANDHLLVAHAALRAQERREIAPALAARARQALAQAEIYLSRLELDCAPIGCEMTLDGKQVTSGRHYVLPGSHRVTARADQRSATQDLLTDAGATYSIELEVAREIAPDDRPSAARTATAPMAPAGAPEPTSESPVSEPRSAPLPVEAFYASLVVTGIVTGITVWSGLDALEKKRELHDPPSQESRDELVASVRRTDILLASSAVLALGTAYIGFELVDFGSAALRAGVTHAGVSLGASGSF